MSEFLMHFQYTVLFEKKKHFILYTVLFCILVVWYVLGHIVILGVVLFTNIDVLYC